MIENDCDNNVILDSSTGRPPYLVTTDGTRQYSLGDDYRKVAMVFMETQDVDYTEERNYRRAEWLGVEVLEIDVQTRPRTRTTAPQIYFPFDPGDTTEKYLVKAYRNATNISSASIDLDVEDRWHDLVIQGALSWIRQEQYGIGDWKEWRYVLMPNEYWDEKNANPTLQTMMTRRYA